jgi:hypothetical protein
VLFDPFPHVQAEEAEEAEEAVDEEWVAPVVVLLLLG